MYQLVNPMPLPQGHTFITIAGNVGAGKSTLARLLGERLNFEVHYEKVDGNPYLEDFYQDQAKWGFHLQLYFLAQRFHQQVQINANGQDNIQDRSIYEDVEIFAKNLYENQLMSERDYQTYRDLFHEMVAHLRKPSLMIYLDGDLDTIVSRIQQRGREMEKAVNIQYWANLQSRYANWIHSYQDSAILFLDINRIDIIEHPEHLDDIVSIIEKYLIQD
ncbi:MAG: deoxynucleoside kinase [Erysipelotrichaceae bacterium]